jgi:hypothetical protein
MPHDSTHRSTIGVNLSLNFAAVYRGFCGQPPLLQSKHNVFAGGELTVTDVGELFTAFLNDGHGTFKHP